MRGRIIWCAVVGLLALDLIAGARAVKADTVISINPMATYLLTNDDPNALNAPAISLSSLGIQDGQSITLQALGSWCPSMSNGACLYSPVSDGLIGVFSSSSTLLASTNLNRVPGAIQTANGSPVVTPTTLFGGVATDISQDFLILQSPGSTTVTVPQGATYLFVSIKDDYYGDNGEPNGLAVDISTVPEPSGLLTLGTGLLFVLGIAKRRSVAF